MTVSEALKTITVFIGPETWLFIAMPTLPADLSWIRQSSAPLALLGYLRVSDLEEANTPQVQCPEQGCVQVSIAWASSHSRYTKKFEMIVLDWLRKTTAGSRWLDRIYPPLQAPQE